MAGKGRRGGDSWWSSNSTNRPILFSILISLVIFFVFQFGFLYREFASLDDQKLMLQAEIHAKERRLDEQQRAILTKERDLHRLERRLEELEQKFRSYNARISSGGKSVSSNPASTKLFLITPTYARPAQKADLTRLSYALMHVPNLYWIVVEDAPTTSSLVAEVLKRSKIPHSLLSVETPEEFKLNASVPNWYQHRGVEQRNAGIAWLRTNMAAFSKSAVVYFADDDNTYDLRLFDEMRTTKTVSVWPVGLVGGLLVERPLLNDNGRIYEWMVGWRRDRPFPIDMAGFAVHLSLILRHPDALFTYDVPRGYQESHLLQKLSITRDQLEPKADNCTKVYVWHTRTEKPKLNVERYWRKKGYRSDDDIEI